MTFAPSRARRLAAHIAALVPVLSIALLGPSSATAQSDPASVSASESVRPPNLEPGEPVPWLYENSGIPVDKAWTFGELDNGVRYAVRRNGVPPGQVSIRLRIDAGSLMEQESEQGFAHLLEHLTFRGSKYVPDGEAIRVWQRLGATFGSDSNAETTPTQTVYKLDLPDATAAGLDESMKVLSGMIREPGLKKAAISAEVPVVLAELRERSGAQAKIDDGTRRLFFSGQALAERSPIGTPETLTAATMDNVRAFHRRWYRPSNLVIAISGDADRQMMEELIARHFGDWKEPATPAPAADFGDPDPDAPVASVIVEPSFPHVMTMAVVRPWRPVLDTIPYNQQLLIDLLATQIINRRLESRARGGGNYLQATVNQDDVARSVDGTFVSIVPLGDDWKAALDDVRGVIADATSSPPSEEEITREVAEIDSAFAAQLDSASTEPSATQADEIVGAVDIRESIASPETALAVFREMRELITPERLLEATQRLFQGTATRLMLVAPQPIEGGEPAVAAALSRDVGADAGARQEAQTVTMDDLPDLGRPGTVESVTDMQMLGMEILTLSNGMRAMIFPNDAEVAKIQVKVRFGRGYQSFTPENSDLLWSGEAALPQSGIGDLSQDQLDRLVTGRRIGLQFAIEADAFAFTGDTRPADLEAQLRLIAAKLAAPRWDEQPVLRAKAAAELAYRSYQISPQAVFERDLQYLLHDKDPRWKTPGKEEIDKLTPESFRALWEPILQQGPVEIMVFGDFDRDTAVAALEKTFGALPPRQPAPIVAGADGYSFPDPVAEPVTLYHDGNVDQAAVFVGWPTGGGLDNIEDGRQLEILSSIFTNRLFEKFRSQDGASYSPQAINSWPSSFTSGGHFGITSQLAPDRIDRFFETVEEIRADLVANPVSEDELARVTEPLAQLVRRAVSGNRFWLLQLQGGSYDVRRISAVRSILRDYSVSTPERIQALAAKYLVADKQWSVVAVPRPDGEGR